MKRMQLLILTMVMILPSHLNAQFVDKLSVELNLGRVATNYGIFESAAYPSQSSFVNGFNIIYQSSKKWQQYVGIRKLNYSVNIGGGFSAEATNVNGFEFSVGTKISPNSERKFFLSYGIELFGEFATHKGIYWVDHDPFQYEIHHRRNYLGIAPNLTLNLRLHDKIVLFTNTRFQFGYVYLNQQEHSDFSTPLYFANNQYSLSTFQPLNAIGVRIELH